MRRLLPYLIFVFVTGGLIAFVYKDRIFPPQAGAEGAPARDDGRAGQGPAGQLPPGQPGCSRSSRRKREPTTFQSI